MVEVKGWNDPDLGVCDWCGSEAGERTRGVVALSDGLYAAWLCAECGPIPTMTAAPVGRGHRRMMTRRGCRR